MLATPFRIGDYTVELIIPGGPGLLHVLYSHGYRSSFVEVVDLGHGGPRIDSADEESERFAGVLLELLAGSDRLVHHLYALLGKSDAVVRHPVEVAPTRGPRSESESWLPSEGLPL